MVYFTIVHPGALTNEHETQQFNMSAQFENVQNPSITSGFKSPDASNASRRESYVDTIIKC
jgi:hypothetical protein